MIKIYAHSVHNDLDVMSRPVATLTINWSISLHSFRV